MVVLDASGLLNSFGFKFDRVFYTTPKVIEEIKDFRSRTLVEVGINEGMLKVFAPSNESINKITETAKKLKLFKKLSNTDIEVLALALERKDILWTDDKAMRRVAEKLGVETEGIIW